MHLPRHRVLPRVQSGFVAAFSLVGGIASPGASSPLLVEHLGNFPDAIELRAEFLVGASLSINGATVLNVTGFHFTLQNTSVGDGAASSFVSDPDGNFTNGDDTLSAAAASAITAAQPFGLYQFGVQLPAGSGVVTSGPSGWELNIESGAPPPGALEVNFEIDLGTPEGLLFDPAAPGLDSIFTLPHFGALDFFVSTPSAELLDNLLAMDNGLPGLDVRTSLAWAEAGKVETEFDAPGTSFDKEELRPRGQLLVPEPAALGMLLAGFVPVLRAWRLRKHRAESSAA